MCKLSLSQGREGKEEHLDEEGACVAAGSVVSETENKRQVSSGTGVPEEVGKGQTVQGFRMI